MKDEEEDMSARQRSDEGTRYRCRAFRSTQCLAMAASALRVILLFVFILHPSSFILASPSFILASASFVQGSQFATVHVKAESTARGDRLTLGNIADVQTNEPRLALQLEAIALGYAPQVGAVRELTKQKIALAISAAGFSTETVSLEAPTVALVRREAQTVDPEFVRGVVQRSLIAALHPAGGTMTLTRLGLPASIEVPVGSIEVRASAGNITAPLGPFPISLEFWLDGKLFKRMTVTAQAEAFALVLVAARDLDAKTRLRPDDYGLEMKPLARNPMLYVSEAGQVRGKSLVHPLARGEAITSDALVADLVIKPGDAVRIIGQSGALSILVMGEARSSGHVGDRIQVKNLQSGLLFQGVIVDEGLVSVRF
jgi:flagella basal body P-ring formation protein FlgA